MKQELNKKIMINRIFLFTFSLVATPIAILWNWAAADNPLALSTLFNILMFFTIWSNIFIFAWSSLAMANIYLESEKIDSILENWLIKTSITLFILITGIVLNFVLIPWFIIDGVWGSFSVFLVFFFGASLFQHLLVPIFMVRDFFLTKGSVLEEKNNKLDIWKKTAISTLVPLSWLISSLIFIYTGILDPQYPFMNLFDTASNTELAINLVILISICISWIFAFYALLTYSNKKYSI